MTVADEIGKLARLRDSGALTDEEFEAQKKILLAQGAAAAAPQPASQPVAPQSVPQPTPQPVRPAPNPERAAKAKRLVIWSKGLGWGGLGTLFLIAPIVGFNVSGPLGIIVGAMGLISAIVGAVLGQVGRGMQGRVI